MGAYEGDVPMGPISGLMTAEGEAKLVGFEGERLFVYDDADGSKPYAPGAKVKGTLTGGIGHTGSEITDYIGKPVPKAVSRRWFREDVAEAAAIVDRAVKVALSPYQRDALISFVFNIGPGKKGVKDGFVEVKRGGPSGLLRAINDGRLDDAPAEFRKWNKSGGVVWPGLKRRREAEIGLWVKGEYVASRTVVPDAPKPKPAMKDGGVLGTILGGVGTVGAGTVIATAEQGGKLKDALEPLFGPWAVPIAAGFVVLSLASVIWIGVRVAQRRKAEAA